MSQSWFTKAKIHRDDFPANGETLVLRGRTVTRRSFDDGESDSLKFALKDDKGLCMGLYFKADGYLHFFDRTIGNWGAEWMKDAILSEYRKKNSRFCHK